MIARGALARVAAAAALAALGAGACKTGTAQRVPSEDAGTGIEAASAKPEKGAPEGDPPVPAAEIPHLGPAPAPVLDGALDEAVWQHAAKLGPFVDVGTGREARGPIRGAARALWDDAHLYVAFEVTDSNVRGGFPKDAVDPHLWERDTVELMVDPDGDGDNKDYYEIQIGPQNLVFDSRFDGYNRPVDPAKGSFGHMDWSAKLTSAVKIEGTLDVESDKDEGYVVEARIPWASFDKAERSPPAPGDAWRVNLYAMQDNGGVAWSPILRKGNFHKASRFGRVTFKK